MVSTRIGVQMSGARSKRVLFGLAAVLALFLVACQPLADPTYRGELLGSVDGTIESDLSLEPPAEVILLWLVWATDPGTVVGDRVPVEGQFPSRFTIDVYLPPPSSALNDLPPALDSVPEPRIGFAWIVVLRAGAAPPGRAVLTHADVKGLSTGSVLGWAEDYVVAYLDRGAAPGSSAAQILGAALPAGFHLMKAVGQSPASSSMIRDCLDRAADSASCSSLFAALVPAEGSGASEVEVRLTSDLSTLRLPLFLLPPKVQQAFGAR
jgi:hypothetical protein